MNRLGQQGVEESPELAWRPLLRETDHVPEYCTCGAKLPPDARFCHKCGKPQFEMPVVEEEPPPVVPVPDLATTLETAHAVNINFRNRAAVKAGLLAAAISSLLVSLPMPMYINLIWMLVCLVGSGFFGVYLYHRRTGEELSTRRGAKMGWITGVFCFVIATVFFTITVIVISLRGGLAQFYRQQLSAQAGPGVDLDELIRIIETPSGLAGILFFSLVMLFFFFTLLPTLGGAMGAKVLEKE